MVRKPIPHNTGKKTSEIHTSPEFWDRNLIYSAIVVLLAIFSFVILFKDRQDIVVESDSLIEEDASAAAPKVEDTCRQNTGGDDDIGLNVTPQSHVMTVEATVHRGGTTLFTDDFKSPVDGEPSADDYKPSADNEPSADDEQPPADSEKRPAEDELSADDKQPTEGDRLVSTATDTSGEPGDGSGSSGNPDGEDDGNTC